MVALIIYRLPDITSLSKTFIQFRIFIETTTMLHLDDIAVRELRPGFFGKFIHGDKGTVTVWDIKKGSVPETHHHVHEQITYVTEGALRMTIGGKDYLFTAGMTHVIPSNVPHSAIAKTDVKVIDFFSPARDDYR